MYFYVLKKEGSPDMPKVLCSGTGRSGWRLESKGSTQAVCISEKQDGGFIAAPYSYEVIRKFYKKVKKTEAKELAPELVKHAQSVWNTNIQSLATLFAGGEVR